MSQEVDSSTGPGESVSNLGGDIDMEEGDAPGEAEVEVEVEAGDDTELPFAGEDETSVRPTFASYLASPIVSLVIGVEQPSVLSAHQALLEQSPYFATACSGFAEDNSVRDAAALLLH